VTEQRRDILVSRSDRVVFLAFLALVIICPLAIWPPSVPGKSSVLKWFIIQTCLPLLIAGWLIIRLLSNRPSIRWHLLSILALGTLAAQVISLLGATNPWLTYIDISRRLGLIAAYFLTLCLVVTDTERDRLVWAVAACGTVAALYGIVQHFGLDPYPWQITRVTPVERGSSTFGHANFAAHFLIMAIPLTLSLLFTRRSTLSRIAVLAMTGAMFYHLTLTGTRGAALGLAAGCAAAVLVCLCIYNVTDSDKRVRRPVSRSRLAAAVVGSCLVGLLFVVAAWRVKGGGPLKDSSAPVRLETWLTASRLFLQHPIVGIGAGNYEVTSMGHWSEMEIARFVTLNKCSYEVHNEFIEIAVEQGIIGLLAFVLLLVAAVYSAYLIARHSRDAGDRWRAIGLIAAVVAVSVDSLFNFDLQTPAAALLFWIILGLISRGLTQTAARS